PVSRPGAFDNAMASLTVHEEIRDHLPEIAHGDLWDFVVRAQERVEHTPGAQRPQLRLPVLEKIRAADERDVRVDLSKPLLRVVKAPDGSGALRLMCTHRRHEDDVLDAAVDGSTRQ